MRPAELEVGKEYLIELDDCCVSGYITAAKLESRDEDGDNYRFTIGEEQVLLRNDYGWHAEEVHRSPGQLVVGEHR